MQASKQYNKSIYIYNEIIQKQPEAYAYSNRGLAKSALGNRQGAMTDMNTAAELFRQQGQMDSYQKAMGLLKKLQGG